MAVSWMNCHIQWPSCVRLWLSRLEPDWGQGYEVSFVTVPGIDERWCQHLSNVWYTLDRNPDMPVVQCDPSPRGSKVLPHPDQAARHPSVDQFIWTMFTRQCLSLSGIKSALSSCKDDGWSVFSHGTGEITCLFRSLNSSLKLERLVGSWDSSSALGECVKVQIYVQCFPSLLLQKLELFTNWNQTSSLKVITLHVNFWWTIQGFCLP